MNASSSSHPTLHPPHPPDASPLDSREMIAGGLCAAALDRVTGAFLIGALITGPWLFGTTQPWAVRLMTATGLTLWLLLVGRWLSRWAADTVSAGMRLRDWPLAVLTSATLGYCLVSAVNARAHWDSQTNLLSYHQSACMWLPRSYDQAATWNEFWMLLGLAGFFWATRAWINGGPESETRRTPGPSRRLRLLLWVVSVNGAALAAVGMIQRLTGTSELLWLVEPAINKSPATQFGPFAYRANAAQYLNLIWPATLALWWVMRDDAAPGTPNARRMLVVLAGITMAGVAATTSRGGALVLALCWLGTAILVIAGGRRYSWRRRAGVVMLWTALGGAAFTLSWSDLAPRWKTFETGLAGRQGFFVAGRQMAADHLLLGTGPGTFSSLYQYYRGSSAEAWPAQLHNDWLQTLITFGGVGLSLLLAALAAAARTWFLPEGQPVPGGLVGILWVGLAGCLLHAAYDFPFQIHSVTLLFLTLTAAVSVLGRIEPKRH